MGGLPPNHPFLDGISHDKASSYWGLRMTSETPFYMGPILVAGW